MQVRLNINMDTLAKRLKFARKERGLTQEQLSENAGVAQSDISKLERGDSQKTTNLIRLAKALACNPEWLDTGDGDSWLDAPDHQSNLWGAPIDLDNNPEYPAIRRVRFKLSAGASGYGVEYREDESSPIVFQRDWYASKGFKPGKLFAVRVTNHSMEPKYHDGDTVVVNTESKAPKDGIAFAVNYEGELVIKRLIRDAGQWWLSSDNPDQRKYPRKVCDENCEIIGEIVLIQSSHT